MKRSLLNATSRNVEDNDALPSKGNQAKDRDTKRDQNQANERDSKRDRN